MTDTHNRVLVADDEPVVRMVMVDALNDVGLDILEAADGAEALKLMRSPDSVDVLVTDVNMPAPDGIAVAQEARSLHPNIPVLFVTARPDSLESPGTPVPHQTLRKPFSMAELVKKVRELLLA